MGLLTTITVTCDNPECPNGRKGPAVISWEKEHVESGKIEMPEAAKYLVLLNQNGKMITFCTQLCASSAFLPPGYDIMQKKVIPIPSTENLQNAPENSSGLKNCKCDHPVHYHNKWGCQAVLSKEPGDFCKCSAQGPEGER
jgi:hypothetical protein